MPFYTPPKPHFFDMDKEPNFIVPVIASFSAKGGVQPLYFQYNDKTVKLCPYIGVKRDLTLSVLNVLQS